MSHFDSTNTHQFSYDPSADICYRTLDFLGFPGYRVGDDGSVWSRKLRGSKTGTLTNRWVRLLCYTNVVTGYVSVYLSGDNDWYVHHLVLRAFVGVGGSWMVALHKNDVSDDNRVSNLQWGTRAQNVDDAIRNGGWPVGEKRTQAKLNDDAVRIIRDSLDRHVPKSRLAKQFGVSISAITQIQRGVTWRHVK